MPSTPSLTLGSNTPGARHDTTGSVSPLQHIPDSLETSTTSHHRLSFPSLNDYKAVGTAPIHPAGSIPPAAIPPQNYTPLTLKSVRAAKSRNKLRQEALIGATAGTQSMLFPKPSLAAQGGEDDGPALESLSSNHLSLPPSLDHAASAEANDPQSSMDQSQSSRRRESSSSSATSHSMPQVLPRPILKDTSARDRMRESWMSEPPGITISSSHAIGAARPASSHAYNHLPSASPSPITPPKSLARSSSAKRQSKVNRISSLEYDQDALTPRPRQGGTGYGPDYKPRRQSGGPGHLLYTLDAASSGPDLESEDYDDSDLDDSQQYSRHLQEQYLLLQKTSPRQSMLENNDFTTGENMPHVTKRGHRKSLGDELNVPPVPEKSAQRKRVSTMGSATLVPVSSSLISAYSTSETLSSVNRSNSQRPKDRRPHGSIGPNSLSFEPLFALSDSGSKVSCVERTGAHRDSVMNRLSAVSDADWYTALLTVDPNQQGVSILDLSKRELAEIPSGLPETITHLRLAHNTIRVFSPINSLTSLNHLQVLDLCDNQLEILPPEIGLLTRLKELHLSNNKLWKLPDNIQKMARLEVLDIRNNQFYLLNPMIGRLKTLRQLDVRQNQLKSLPAQLCMLSSTLTVLLVDGNQFVQPFLDLLQPLMIDDKESGRQTFLSDDPYADSYRSTGSSVQKMAKAYEPWRRSITPNSVRRIGGGAPGLVKRRSHGDLMSLIGLQRKDDVTQAEDISTGMPEQAQKPHTISASSGAQIAASLNAENTGARRERSVSTSTVTLTEYQTEIATPTSSSSSSPHPLSLNKFLKSIRKSSKASLKDNQMPTKPDNSTKRLSVGSEAGHLADIDLDLQDPELKPSSKGSASGGSNGRRAASSGINQWVRDRFHKRSNSNELGVLPYAHASAMSLNTDVFDGVDCYPVRDSGYGGIGGPGSQLNASLGSTPDLSETLSSGKGSGIFESRFQNRSTGHLPYGAPLSPKDTQLSASFDPTHRKEMDYRYSCMSVESQITQGTENESEIIDLDSAIAHQQHRLSSVHSPTTPLPSSPIISGVATSSPAASHWSSANPRYGQSAAHIKPLMQYLKDLYDLDPDSSEWEEVHAWRRVWNGEASGTTAHGATPGDDNVEEDEGDRVEKRAKDEGDRVEKRAKDEEIRIAKLQAQASRRRRIVDEIMTTERTYVDGLKGLVDIYLTPALQVMQPGDHKGIFSNAQSIYTFHANHFLPELEKAYRVQPQEQSSTMAPAVMSPNSPIPTGSSVFPSHSSDPLSNSADGQESGAVQQTEPKESDSKEQAAPASAAGATGPSLESVKMAVEDRIGRVFAEHVAYMKMYSFYINNYDNSLRVLQTQLTSKHKKKMKEFLRRCAKHPNHTQLTIQGYLLLPIQRIPRYKMLLQDLLENTWPDHVDYQDIATALEMISSRADEMNERKRQHENHEKVLLVQNRIVGNYKTELVQPYRKVVREGMLHLIRVVTRNVVMGVDKVVLPPIANDQSIGGNSISESLPQVGDLTVHHLSEETVERSYLFILFNDILIQCSPVNSKGSGNSSGNSNGQGSMHTSSSPAGSSSAGAASANANMGAKNLELRRVLQLESRLHPAEIIGQDVLRVVDDKMVLYLTGDRDVVQAWKDDINTRW
ncbi:hypothetical protein BGX26_006773 [Mortierella sp. AD094]|nr:hypothetical protein BGX26_006773 [Mortierella sp. AD094]